jgi:hypothetical protein
MGLLQVTDVRAGANRDRFILMQKGLCRAIEFRAPSKPTPLTAQDQNFFGPRLIVSTDTLWPSRAIAATLHSDKEALSPWRARMPYRR